MPIMFASAMPISKKRWGNFFANISDFVLFARSASRATTFGYFSPIFASASPKASRVALAAISCSLR